MITNFKIEDIISICSDNYRFDLHNDYDFKGFDYRTEDLSVILHWVKSKGDWVKTESVDIIDLIHSKVSYFKVSERDQQLPNSEDECLSSISFYPSTDRFNNDRIVSKFKPDIDDDIIYNFQSEQVIRICCEEIQIVLRNKSSAA